MVLRIKITMIDHNEHGYLPLTSMNQRELFGSPHWIEQKPAVANTWRVPAHATEALVRKTFILRAVIPF